MCKIEYVTEMQTIQKEEEQIFVLYIGFCTLQLLLQIIGAGKYVLLKEMYIYILYTIYIYLLL